MSARATRKAQTKTTKRASNTAKIVWFEIPADDPKRAKKFYGSLFGWKVQPFPGMTDYWHIDTGGGDETPDGGLMVRKHPGQPITNYMAVSSLDKSAAKVKKLGGTICKPKTAVPKMGYFVICQDTEDNMFALWESDTKAK